MRTLAHTRDGSLRRLRLINRWMLIGSVVLTAMLTLLVSRAFPSKASASRVTTRTGAHKSSKRVTHHHSPPRHSYAPKSLQPAAEPPAASTQAERTTTEAPQETASSEAPPPSEEAHEAAPPAHEAAPDPVHEAPPAEEPAAPVVSGGS